MVVSSESILTLQFMAVFVLTYGYIPEKYSHVSTSGVSLEHILILQYTAASLENIFTFQHTAVSVENIFNLQHIAVSVENILILKHTAA